MQQFYITFWKAFAGLAPRAANVSFRYTFMQQLGRDFFKISGQNRVIRCFWISESNEGLCNGKKSEAEKRRDK